MQLVNHTAMNFVLDGTTLVTQVHYKTEPEARIEIDKNKTYRQVIKLDRQKTTGTHLSLHGIKHALMRALEAKTDGAPIRPSNLTSAFQDLKRMFSADKQSDTTVAQFALPCLSIEDTIEILYQGKNVQKLNISKVPWIVKSLENYVLSEVAPSIESLRYFYDTKSFIADLRYELPSSTQEVRISYEPG